jgi:hypothetical protein
MNKVFERIWMHNRGKLFFVAALCAGALLPGAGALVGGCGSDGDGSGTSGKRVALKTKLASAPELTAGFTTGKGWDVKLTRALVSTGPLYYYDGVPAVVRRAPHRSPRERLASLLGLGIAHAHPGHYLPGDARGQVFVGASVDLFDGPADLPQGDGISGPYRSATFSLAQGSPGPAAAALGAAVVVTEGAATKGGATVYFRLSATYADVTANATEGRITGCAFDEVDVQDDGLVTATISPSFWFNLVGFESIAPGTAEAPTAVAEGDKAQIEFALGLAQIGAYHFTYSK